MQWQCCFRAGNIAFSQDVLFMNPDNQDLWFIPLGGCGEIGMNMNLYGHDDSWLMVDCGVTFAKPSDGSVSSQRQTQMADPAFIVERREKLAGIILTHAHEDHIGALPWIWESLRCPIYTTRFTAEMLRRKLVEHQLEGKVPVRVVEDGDRIGIGPFMVEWIENTHSIPEPFGLCIETDVGSVFHTADWKLDPDPVVGSGFNPARYKKLGELNLDAMVCDSTCATVGGSTLSEGALYPGLKQLIAEASGRVVVACFGSNIGRLATLARIADETDRHLGILGRSLINTVSAARSTGYWQHAKPLVDPEHLGYLPRESVLLVATGSQGEARTAMHRLSLDTFRNLSLDPGDTVIFSARMIPGNELDIEALIERLKKMQVNVITPLTTDVLIHTSGHPAVDDLRNMYDWVKPTLSIPVHGESHHIDAHRKVAESAGVARQLVGKNGDLFFLAPNKGVRRGVAQTGRLGVENNRLRAV